MDLQAVGQDVLLHPHYMICDKSSQTAKDNIPATVFIINQLFSHCVYPMM